ncbi:MAG: hypothetical protein K6B52_03915 [Clostridiales bacterium]|nr:hypothetical protein [Clostridiales bacterium]
MRVRMSSRIFTFALALVLVFTPVVSAFAQSGVNQDCPYIFVNGFMSSEVVADKSNRDSEALWGPSAESILNTVKKGIPAAMKFLVTKDYDALFDTLLDPLYEMLCKANLGADGNPIGNSGAYFEYPEASLITKNSCLDFKYDWRVDPIETATKLNDFIEYVCNSSGCEKICLEGHSFGGLVINTYATLFGTDRIKSVCLNTTAIFGETYTGELLTGKIQIDDLALVKYLENVTDYSSASKIISEILEMLLNTGLVEDICELGNQLIIHSPPEAYSRIIGPMFAGWLSIWAMIPDEFVDEAKEYVFGTIFKNDSTDRSGLIEKIEDYNRRVRPYKKQNLLKLNEDCNLYIISRYGYVSFPMTPSWANMSDTVVDTKFSSFGATCAPYGMFLPDVYIDSHDSKYISPDKRVDASTCLFPEQTWFIRDFEHSKSCDDFKALVMTLLYSPSQATVDTYEQYPQFLAYDSKADAITADNYTAKLTFMDRVRNFFIQIIYWFKNLFK